MERKELELLEKLAPDHPDVKVLWENHILFNKQLEKLESKAYLTPDEQTQVRQIKKQKLEGKTKLVALLNKYATEE
ncbi:MAG: DUF465 domain-containing protein [Desulfovibrio sp.]|nr:DUF465 domain-containing protein [Desulfovibrio sp.]